MNSRTAARTAVETYRHGGTLDGLPWTLEDIAIWFEDHSVPISDQLRGGWSHLEIVNAVNLSEGRPIDSAEVDELIDEITKLLEGVEEAGPAS